MFKVILKDFHRVVVDFILDVVLDLELALILEVVLKVVLKDFSIVVLDIVTT